jgi:3-hydroxymyristoyl/3-hydroxydecanoyl-(acyl carrier protein) dehydratase
MIEELRADCPYGPGGFLIDEILEIDAKSDFVRARMPTTDDDPITREQRAHPVRHPRHVSGALMIHMTGMIAYVHTYCVLGLRHADGWVGYGGRIYSARFKALARPGEPLVLECKATQMRKSEDTLFARYEFRFFQNTTEVYQGDQSALWMRVKDSEASLSPPR